MHDDPGPKDDPRHCSRCGREALPGTVFPLSGGRPECPECLRRRGLTSHRGSLLAWLLAGAAGWLIPLFYPDSQALMVVGNLSLVWLFMILTVVPHELAHAVMARLLRVPVQAVVIGLGPVILRRKIAGFSVIWRVLPFGGWVQLKPREKPYPLPAEFLISAAGPGVHLLLAAAVWCTLPRETFTQPAPHLELEFAAAFFVANVLQFLFNAIPRRFDSDTGPAVTDGLAMCQILFLRRHPFVPDPDKPHPLKPLTPLFWVFGLGAAWMVVQTYGDTHGDGVPWRPFLWLAVCGFFIWAAGAVRDPAEQLGYVRHPANAALSPAALLRSLQEAELATWRSAPDPTPPKQAALAALALTDAGARKAALAAIDIPAELDDPWLHWLQFKAITKDEDHAAPPYDVCTAFEWPALRAAGILAKVQAAAHAGGSHVAGIPDIVEDYLESDPPGLAVLLVKHGTCWLALSHPLPGLYPLAAQWAEANVDAAPADPWLLCCWGTALVRTGRFEEGLTLLNVLKPGVFPDETAGTALLFRALAARESGDPDNARRLAEGARLSLPEDSAMRGLLKQEFAAD